MKTDPVPGGTYTVARDETGEWVATCSDYPSLSWVGQLPWDALVQLAKVVSEVEEDED